MRTHLTFWSALCALALFPLTHASGIECSSSAAIPAKKLICEDSSLTTLYTSLEDTYRKVSLKGGSEQRLEPREPKENWRQQLNSCLQGENAPLCLANSLRTRRAELQARFELIEGSPEKKYKCDDGKVVTARFFNTKPRSLIASRGRREAFLTLQPSASGARYLGKNHSFWEHQGQAMVQWGLKSEGILCRLKV